MLPSGLMRLQLPSFRNDAIKFAELNNLKGLAEKPALNFSRYQLRGGCRIRDQSLTPSLATFAASTYLRGIAGLNHPPASSDYRPLIAFEVDSSFHDYAEGVNNQLSSPEDAERLL